MDYCSLTKDASETPLTVLVLKDRDSLSILAHPVLRKGRLRIGDVLLEGTGVCAPCSRMEENLGSGGFHAMRGHGGITAAVIEPGELKVGQTVEFAGPAEGA